MLLKQHHFSSVQLHTVTSEMATVTCRHFPSQMIPSTSELLGQLTEH